MLQHLHLMGDPALLGLAGHLQGVGEVQIGLGSVLYVHHRVALTLAAGFLNLVRLAQRQIVLP